MDNMWNYMIGRPHYGMGDGGGTQGPGIYGYGHWSPGFGSGPYPGYGHGPWMPPKKDKDDKECRAILRCIQRCMQNYSGHKPCEDSVKDFGPVGGYEIGPVAGYGWGHDRLP